MLQLHWFKNAILYEITSVIASASFDPFLLFPLFVGKLKSMLAFASARFDQLDDPIDRLCFTIENNNNKIVINYLIVSNYLSRRK